MSRRDVDRGGGGRIRAVHWQLSGNRHPGGMQCPAPTIVGTAFVTALATACFRATRVCAYTARSPGRPGGTGCDAWGAGDGGGACSGDRTPSCTHPPGGHSDRHGLSVGKTSACRDPGPTPGRDARSLACAHNEVALPTRTPQVPRRGQFHPPRRAGQSTAVRSGWARAWPCRRARHGGRPWAARAGWAWPMSSGARREAS